MKIGPYEIDTVVTGDAMELTDEVPDESVNLVFTDPVYWEHDQYEWLAREGLRILVDGGILIAQAGNPDVPVLIPRMEKYLDYQRILCEKFPVATQAYRMTKCFVGWKPYLMFSKGERNGGWIFDAMMGGGKNKKSHKWGDSPKVFIQWINRLTEPGDVVFDPFTGGGTVPCTCKILERHFLAFELDPDTADDARRAIENTNPPLPFNKPKQRSLL